MPRKPFLVLAILAAVALTAAGAALGHSTAMPTLKGVVGPGYTIKLTKGGTRVKSLKAGKFRFVITDRSSIHNFTVEREKPTMPKIEKHLTSTAFMGKRTVVMTLKPGSWRFYCSNHEALMHHDFAVRK